MGLFIRSTMVTVVNLTLLWTLTHRAILIQMLSLSVPSNLMFCSTAAGANKPSDVLNTPEKCVQSALAKKALVFMVFSLVCMNNSKLWFIYIHSVTEYVCLLRWCICISQWISVNNDGIATSCKG